MPPVKRTDSTQLDQASWLKAAAVAIAEDGISGTRILPLSKRLGVTRGSFYWHFKDHSSFVNEFIDYWKAQQLLAVKAFRYESTDPIKRYEQLLNVVLLDTASHLKRLKVEFALRGFARRDAYAANAISDVDRARVNLFMPLAQDAAASTTEAESLAQLLLVQVSGAQLALAGPNCGVDTLLSIKRAMLKSLSALHVASQQLKQSESSGQ